MIWRPPCGLDQHRSQFVNPDPQPRRSTAQGIHSKPPGLRQSRWRFDALTNRSRTPNNRLQRDAQANGVRCLSMAVVMALNKSVPKMDWQQRCRSRADSPECWGSDFVIAACVKILVKGVHSPKIDYIKRCDLNVPSDPAVLRHSLFYLL